ncbi:LAGLIDADG family homing endonuclease [Spirulina major CS-329]|uniref:LAGLIDADG family homing endonuclease n=1 Tax=Spirulina TaxID=1154 RepID=UPI00232E25DA|nr:MULTISPECIES: LAGLIDADG family homing endonuclease [Spirulina]MDB9496424.1 LAGLIDADG family homing endonuclease [Spirulina subsalsa CS-330]MDB9504365.1 LAGLIDADG family homing endonuclease [Spirulina major CS-329]
MGRRAGAVTVSLDIWHLDIPEFLECQTENGDVRRKAYDVFPQIVIVDEFMRRVKNKQDWTLVDPYEVNRVLGFELAELWGDRFDAAYAEVEQACSDGRLKLFHRVNARELFKEAMRTQVETGLPYMSFKDTINRLNPNKHDGYIPATNLCVAPETKILTRHGQVAIAELEGQQVDVWNGEEWSNVLIRKTGENRELIKVTLSNGEILECTPQHHFWIKNHYQRRPERISAQDLQRGDKLIKYELPVMSSEFDVEFPHAYTAGFFTGDGSYGGSDHQFPEIDLYGEKRELLPYIEVRNKLQGSKHYTRELDKVAVFDDIQQDRIICKLPLTVPPKFTVPMNGYTVKSRINWLAGLLDSDGTVSRNGLNESVSVSSINLEFLRETRLMLQTLGVDSFINEMQTAGYRLLPDGKGGQKDYYCQTGYRLLISSVGLSKLAELGLKTHRLKWVYRKPQRAASHHIQVVSIEQAGRISDTYCFTEPKRHMGMFNGVLTGQCVESFSNVTPGKFSHTCNLVSLNLANIDDDLAHHCETSVRILDNTIDLTNAPFAASGAHNDRYRTIGVGAMGLADWLAKRRLKYGDRTDISALFEDMGYHCTRYSMELAQERGAYPAFEGSEWSRGNVLGGRDLDWIDANATQPERWHQLARDIQTHGIRNSHVTAIAPNTSSSLVQGCTASILPTYSKFYYDKWAKGVVPIAPPFIGDRFWFYTENKVMDQRIVVDAVATIQQWIDTGISMELLFNLNEGVYRDGVLTAKDIYETLIHAWESGCKAIYYIRTVQKDNYKESDHCVACAN